MRRVRKKFYMILQTITIEDFSADEIIVTSTPSKEDQSVSSTSEFINLVA